VRVLLDTNIFLWCIGGPKSRLSRRAAKVVEDEDTELLLSAVSIWEIALKAHIGKLEIPEEKSFFQEQMGLLGIQLVLPVEASHVFELFNLPDYHRDPFDRLLIAQCMSERIPLVASHAAIRRYPLEVIW
jgi:PIN domain nuclease of toxin-antitoxin system